MHVILSLPELFDRVRLIEVDQTSKSPNSLFICLCIWPDSFEQTHTTNMYCWRRASSRLPSPSLPSTCIIVTRSISRCAVTPCSISPLPSQTTYRPAVQTRWYSNKDLAPPPPQQKEQNTPILKEESIQQSNNEPSKRKTRHRLLDEQTVTAAAANETVYVGNLFYDITAEDLRAHMEQFGTVLHAIITHDNRGLSKGFGYVQFNTVEEASNAVKNQHLKVLEGRQVVVQFARSQIDYRKRSHPPSDVLFIGGIPFEFTDRDLQDLFSDVTLTTDIRIPVDRRSGMPRGFAHAEFINTEAAMRAKEILSRKAPYGRKLTVEFTHKRRVGFMEPQLDPVHQGQLERERDVRRSRRERRAQEAGKMVEDVEREAELNVESDQLQQTQQGIHKTEKQP